MSDTPNDDMVHDAKHQRNGLRGLSNTERKRVKQVVDQSRNTTAEFAALPMYSHIAIHPMDDTW